MLPDTLAELLLIVEAEGERNVSGPWLRLNDRNWTVKAISDLQIPSGAPADYVCVSYIWGPDRMPNPLHVGPKNISTNTLPALSAAMQNTETKAFWVDAFCVPTVEPARAATLESMGFIFSQAKEVRAVLSKSSFLAVKQLTTGDRLDNEALATLEVDKWIQSVWTYQEVVNCRDLAFICSGALGDIVDGRHFLNGIGYSISEYKKEQNVDSFAFRKKFPSLDTFEELILDWMMAGYQERSALAVISNMDRRNWNKEENYFYSMIGAITSEPCRRSDSRKQHLAEVFMKICEAKRDFSFIYSSAPRSMEPDKRWRPRIGLLPCILPWHCWGESQPGHFDESGSLWLDQILVFQTSHLSEKAKDYVTHWLHREASDQIDEHEIGEQMYSALVGMGFTGNANFIPLTYGMFFPQTSLSVDTAVNIYVLVSGTIRWTLGAPGIASYTGEDGASCFISGVFAGIIDNSLATSVKLI